MGPRNKSAGDDKEIKKNLEGAFDNLEQPCAVL
jgi:hypothetical protein